MIKSLFKCTYSHRLLVVGMILAPKSRCSVPGSFEDETLLICIIYIQEKVHQSIPNADTGLPWCTWCWNSSLVYSFNIKLQVSGSSWWGGVVWFSCIVTWEEYWNSLTVDSAYRPHQMSKNFNTPPRWLCKNIPDLNMLKSSSYDREKFNFEPWWISETPQF